MPKVKSQKFGYSHERQAKNATNGNNSAAARSLAPLFNKDLGQHILKNPLVAQGIVEKVHNVVFA
jgi:18S rRNA (adenine1779-N6/adenine1780-N6)-dimethyltransferase